jgi:COP9 signalosome complex subunit 3
MSRLFCLLTHLDGCHPCPLDIDTKSWQIINPSLNSIPYIFVLLANINALQKKPGNSLSVEALWERMAVFVHSFDPRQIRYLGFELGEIITALIEFAQQIRQVRL